MKTENKFSVGDIVTLKSHPLFKGFRIQGDTKLVPPLMIVKEILVENDKKKLFEEITGNKIADRIKYTCVYFDDNQCCFNELMVYEEFIKKFDSLKIERITEKGEIVDDSDTIINEINSYYASPLKYEFGKVVRFLTKKIEIYKKRSSKEIPVIKNEGNGQEVVKSEKIKTIIKYVVNYASPDFIISGFKKNEVLKAYYPDGSPKRVVCEDLVKVQWFNSNKQKFSEEYLPIVCFTDKMKFK
ncbi:hypothetical protein KUL118_49340 [Tenacibaculum sp. KUL118]|nr:hypothetical protein KUL118_49340 [Tenacibaculum sp. KUL118]